MPTRWITAMRRRSPATPRPHSPTTSASSGSLRARLEGEVRFDAFTRGRYATDASIYQIMPAGVVFPKTRDDVAAALGDRARARRAGHRARRRHLAERPADRRRARGRLQPAPQRACTIYDPDGGTVTVEPGVVLEHLNARLQADGLFFPVEPSTASRCTIGGMAGNNSCGARSIRYGKMVDNVLAIDALLADGERVPLRRGSTTCGGSRARSACGARAAHARRSPSASAPRSSACSRRCSAGSAATTSTRCSRRAPNLAHLLVGSEGTLALTTARDAEAVAPAGAPGHGRVPLPLLPRRHGDDAAPRGARARSAVELVDNNVLVLGADIPLFRRTLARHHARASRTACCSSSSPARTCDALLRRPPAPRRSAWPTTASRTPSSRSSMPARAAAGLGGARGLPQHHDVDEGRREAGLLHRGLRRAARAPRRLHRRRSPSSSPATAPAAPGTPTPRSAACTCARSST